MYGFNVVIKNYLDFCLLFLSLQNDAQRQVFAMAGYSLLVMPGANAD